MARKVGWACPGYTRGERVGTRPVKRVLRVCSATTTARAVSLVWRGTGGHQPYDAVAPFRRRLRCNGRLAPVPKAEVLDRLPPLTRRHYDDFVRCADCGRVYWKGALFRRMERVVARPLARRPPTPPPERG